MPKRSRSPSPSSLSALGAAETDLEAAHRPKYHRASTSPSTSPPPTSAAAVAPHPMQCTLPPHAPLDLPSAADFDAHYAREHTNRCAECRANLPSPWLLELHHTERHDPLVAAKREKEEKTYKCFIETCDKVTLTPQKRRLHLIDKHEYPRNYDFRIVDTGLGKRSSLLREGKGGQKPVGGRRRRVSDVGDLGWQASAKERNGAEGVGSQSGRRTAVEDRKSDGAEPVGRTLKSPNGIGHAPDLGPEDMDLERASKARPAPKATTSTAKNNSEADVDQLADGVATLRFVPLSVRLKLGRPGPGAKHEMSS